jgi:hypothetical protein
VKGEGVSAPEYSTLSVLSSAQLASLHQLLSDAYYSCTSWSTDGCITVAKPRLAIGYYYVNTETMLRTYSV